MVETFCFKSDLAVKPQLRIAQIVFPQTLGAQITPGSGYTQGAEQGTGPQYVIVWVGVRHCDIMMKMLQDCLQAEQQLDAGLRFGGGTVSQVRELSWAWDKSIFIVLMEEQTCSWILHHYKIQFIFYSHFTSFMREIWYFSLPCTYDSHLSIKYETFPFWEIHK